MGKVLWETVEKILKFVICRICHIKMREETWEKILQFVKFTMVGFSNVIVSYGIYLVFFLLFQEAGILPNFDYLIAQWIGYVLSIFWSFYWNRLYVFAAGQGKVPWYSALLKSFIAYSFTGIFLNGILSVFWVRAVCMPKIIVPVINLIINVPINFILNKFWAFRERQSNENIAG